MPDPRLSPKVAAAMRAAVTLAGGREVCFVCTQNAEGVLETARVVARGAIASVLALPGFAQRGEMLVHNHPSGVLDPSDADLQVAARVHDDGIGFGIIDNPAQRLYVVVEIPSETPVTRLDADAVSADLGVGGVVAARHAHFEDRPAQRDMARLITDAYNDGGVALVEAGTGVGKSLGYLVPALRWAAANGERTIVSTNTINLQEQLVRKDLPFLARALSDQPVRFALLKGWHNYVCIARLQQARASARSLLEDDKQAELDALYEWSRRTADGSRSDLATPPTPDVWDEVAAESDLCTRMQCPHFNECFVFKARRAAAQADVVVVNHHLLLADVAVRRASQNWGEAAVVPSYQRLVVDEGHHLEDAAAAHLGRSVTRRGLQRLFGRLERNGRGLLPTLVARLTASRDLLSEASVTLILERLDPAVRTARERSANLFDMLDQVLAQSAASMMRLTDDFATHPVWRGGLRVALENTLSDLVVLDEGLERVRERLEATQRADDVQPLLSEMRAVSRRLQNAGDALRDALDPAPGTPTVRWIETRGRGRDKAVMVASVPLDLAPILRDDLFSRVTTAVVTSATLAAEGSFQFIQGRLGLTTSELEPVTRTLPSPFDFKRQALLALPTDIPAPNRDMERHAHAVVRIAMDLAEAADGGLFVLFTSHREVRRAAELLRGRNVERRWPLFVHGEGEEQRDRLLTRFQESGRGILLGTASFWEGVDVPGDPLRALLIAKLPFRVPTEPLTAARCEAIQEEGGDPFASYMIPDAALKLKQGFGRLIRSSSDRGAVVIADSRAVTARYGADLLRGLPPARRISDPWEDLLPQVRAFYAAGPASD